MVCLRLRQGSVPPPSDLEFQIGWLLHANIFGGCADAPFEMQGRNRLFDELSTVSLDFCKVLRTVNRKHLNKTAKLPPIKSIIFDRSR